MFKVALTGGIASGKSSVATEFKQLGVPIIDADELAREAVKPGSASLAKISNLFGPAALTADGELDRRHMRKWIFTDRQAREQLESIIHPEVRRLVSIAQQKIEAGGHPYCIIMIPLLVETGQASKYDRTLVVDVDIETQISRLMQRDKCTKEAAISILGTQTDRQTRLTFADDVINNNTEKADIDSQVQKLHYSYLELAQTKD